MSDKEEPKDIEEGKIDAGDIPFKEDLFFAIANIQAVEEHLQTTIGMDKSDEIWCVSKHLMNFIYRLREASTKEKDEIRAIKLLELSREYYNIFWLIKSIRGKKDSKIKYLKLMKQIRKDRAILTRILDENIKKVIEESINGIEEEAYELPGEEV